MDVALAFAKGRKRNFNRVEAVVQVLAKLALVDFFEHVDVCGADHAHIHFLGLGRPNLDEFTGFEHPKQAHLSAEGQLANLVEKNGSAVGLFKVALARASGPGKGALFVAKKL